MNQKIQLKIKKLPRALAELSHSNQFLKMSAFCSYGVCLLLVALCIYQAAKPPVVFSFAPDASVYQNSEMPNPENEIKQAIKAYIERRYKWEPKTVRGQLEGAKVFIDSALTKNYDTAASNVARFSIEKSVSQRVFTNKILVNLSKRSVSVSGDRITEIQGLKAAGDLKLELSFDYGARSLTNPWGIYVTKEREE